MSKSRDVAAMPAYADVVIVGAGFAGLSAADRLSSLGHSVLVLEGRDRVGGRSFTGEVAGVKVDLGATWVSKRHSAIRNLAERMGCTTTPQFSQGRNVLWLAKRRHTYNGTIPKLSPATLVNMGRIQLALDKLASTINPDAPWASPRAAEFDAISFEEWLDRKRARATTRAMMTIVSKVEWGCQPSDVSLLHVLRTIRAFGGFDHMLDNEGGMQDERYRETTQEIAVRLAASLGDRVVTDAPVRRIEQDDTGVTVFTDTAQVEATYAIVTTATEHRLGIDFEPALPEVAQGLARSWGLGKLSKAFVAYDRPFWRTNGLSGEAVTDTGAVFITYDVSPDPAGPGILMAFCDPRVFDTHPPEVRREMVVRQLTDLYGPHAANPIDYIDHCWNLEPFAPGGPNPVVAPHAALRYGPALTEPHGRIHWAGTETAGEWTGSMNGAVLTGLRAAERIAARLRVDHGVLA
ncbi:putative flavin-containing monoamine oxidase AofH [Nocardioides phosphati]|uniref:Flavin-containing monoamine oxidase AofH n=1 Tax=Nocardioides phosphati TaxID=1867775 RepID=A0ABQ2N6C3_9ACTN|nr:flavin monoamine oxidase family protein [Nocardioides phosphati]GGO86158.1 putative flavin-containing monoamine oxidase AofH [Nocardioides phosphati]